MQSESRIEAFPKPWSLTLLVTLLAHTACSGSPMVRVPVGPSDCLGYLPPCHGGFQVALERALQQDHLTLSATVPISRESCFVADACLEHIRTTGGIPPGDLTVQQAQQELRVMALGLLALEVHSEGVLAESCPVLEQAEAVYQQTLDLFWDTRSDAASNPFFASLRELCDNVRWMMEELGCPSAP